MTASSAPAPGAQAPAGAHALALLPLSDSFREIWYSIATECGLSLESIAAEDTPDGRRTLVVIAAGGVEDRLAAATRSLRERTDLPLAAVGALTDHRLAAAVVRAGASDYFALPDDLEFLKSWILDGAERLRLRDQGRRFAEGEARKYRFEGILGSSPALEAALARAARVIPYPTVTVLITGETGTGKELLARAIHYDGARATGPFVDVNCAALPEHLLESELFGHEKGAFTDARAAKPGLFEMANGGTVFLDEIGHLAPSLQGKLLRALQERTIRRVGGTRSIPIDVRIVAATHVDLEAAVRAGTFREDLFYRLNVMPLALPPLRERRPDIVPIARHLLARFAADYGKPVPVLTNKAERQLVAREWPGNIRELRNVVERAMILCETGTIDVADLEAEMPARRPRGSLPFPARLADIVTAAVVLSLEATGGNKSEAARRLGITRPRLQRLLDHQGEDTDGGSDE